MYNFIVKNRIFFMIFQYKYVIRILKFYKNCQTEQNSYLDENFQTNGIKSIIHARIHTKTFKCLSLCVKLLRVKLF